MQFTGAVCLAVFVLTTAVSASRNIALHRPVVKKASVVHKSLLGGRSNAKLGCKVGDPDCGEQLKLIMAVTNVVKKAEDMEKKTEDAEIEAQKLTEVVAEVESAKKEEQSQEAEEVAVDEKVKTVQDEVKKQDAEIREEKQDLEAEDQTLKKIPNPEAAAIVMKDEEKMKTEVEAKEIGKEVKLEEEKTVKQEKSVVEMKVAVSKAKVEAKVQIFKADETAVKRMKKQFDAKEMYQLEVKTYNVATEVVKSSSKKPVDPEKATVPELVVEAEKHKVQEATEKINQAKIEAKEAEIKEKKAEEKMEEVVVEAKAEEVTKEMTKVADKYGGPKKLEEELARCQPCEVPPAAPMTAKVPGAAKLPALRPAKAAQAPAR